MIITDQEKLNNLVMNAYHREIEVQAYQVNIDNYTVMLQALPTTEWDSDISQWSTTSIIDLPHSLTDEQVQRITDFQYRDYLRGLIRTERAEQSKTIRVLDALKLQIGNDYITLVQNYKNSQA